MVPQYLKTCVFLRITGQKAADAQQAYVFPNRIRKTNRMATAGRGISANTGPSNCYGISQTALLNYFIY